MNLALVQPSSDLQDLTLIERLTTLTDSQNYDTTYLTHGIHPYAAKYIPQLPNLIVAHHTNERNTVLDPFCGSGTTLLECALLGRKSIGIDAHPIATLISRAKTTALSPEELVLGRKLYDNLGRGYLPSGHDVIPRAKNLTHWFCESAIEELASIGALICDIESTRLRTFFRCIFSSVIVGVSRQESETRYAANKEDLPVGQTIRRFRQKLGRELVVRQSEKWE